MRENSKDQTLEQKDVCKSKIFQYGIYPLLNINELINACGETYVNLFLSLIQINNVN